jgi:lipopolysaccharide transport system ATP-binding protein
VAALLELGLGFHPEFTGRQNAVLAGQLLGLSAATMRALLPQIAEFAEIGEYFDEPVRVYSSGMQVRLAFAVATAVRPDVLIVDEALSVGDAYFQHKCFARIREFRAAGTTLLFVSHDSAAILGLCDRAVLLHGGRVARQGGPQEVLDFYNALLADPQGRSIKVMQAPGGGMRTVSGSGQARLVAVRMTDEEGVEMAAVPVGARVCLEVEVEAVQTLPSLVVGYAIRDRLGQMVFGTNTAHLGALLEGVEAGARVRFCFEFVANLGPGSYAVSVAAHAGETHVQGNYEWRDVALVFEVVNAEHAPFLGLAWLPPKLSVEQVNG